MFSTVLVFLGVGVICFLVINLIYTLYILKNGIETDAVLIRIPGGRRLIGILQYTVDGKEYEIGLDGAIFGRKEGDRVKIYYLKKNPKSIAMKGSFLIYRIVGVVSILIIVLFAYLGIL
jgi:hypothetical protein